MDSGTPSAHTPWKAPDKRVHGRGCAGDSGGGALSSFETTVLLTVGETMDVLRKAEQVQYEAPGAPQRASPSRGETAVLGPSER